MENRKSLRFFCVSNTKKFNILCWFFFSKKERIKKLKRSLDNLVSNDVLVDIEFYRSEFSSFSQKKTFFFTVKGYLKSESGKWKVMGSGEEYNEELAALKAFSEFFERLGGLIFNIQSEFLKNKERVRSTNGCAAHFSIKKAKEKSYFELIERDAFLSHWYTRTQADKLECPLFMRSFLNKISSLNFNLNFYNLISADKRSKTILCLIKREKYVEERFNVFLGLSSGTNLKKSILKSFDEANRFFNEYFLKNQEGKPRDINCDYLRDRDLSNLIKFQDITKEDEFDFLNHEGPRKKWKRYGYSVEYKLLPVPKDLAGEFFVVNAKSSDLQDLDFFKQPKLNKKRLSFFCEKWNEKDIRKHPIP